MKRFCRLIASALRYGKVERRAENMETIRNRSGDSGYCKIAVTGGIGSGKSTVCEEIARLGYSVFSCDEIYGEMLGEPDFAAAMEILFPGSTSGGRVNKKELLKIILRNEKATETLNAFTHPKIMARLFERMDEAAKQTLDARNANSATAIKKPWLVPVFAEVPLLFESKSDGLFDKIIVVTRNETEKIHSVIVRDGCKEDVVKEKMALQFDYSLPPDKKNYPSYDKIIFLENNGSKNQLKLKLIKILQQI